MVPASLALYGGWFMVRGGKIETLEGDWKPKRFVMVEFPSVEKAKAWWVHASLARRTPVFIHRAGLKRPG